MELQDREEAQGVREVRHAPEGRRGGLRRLQVQRAQREQRGRRGAAPYPRGLLLAMAQAAVSVVGWNQIAIRREVPLLDGVPDESFFYFVHSYYFDCYCCFFLSLDLILKTAP